MELILYHTQGVLYIFLFLLFIVKFIVNAIVHRKTDSYIHNIEKFEGVGHFGDSKRTRRSQDYENALLTAFTTWWDIKKSDDFYLKRIKKFSNFVNILFLFLAIAAIFFFLWMQEVNHTYRHLDMDPWQYLPDRPKQII